MNGLIYLMLCAVFLVLSALVAALAAQVESRRIAAGKRATAEQTDFAQSRHRPAARLMSAAALAAVVLVLLTAVFDNVMIAVGLFTYEEQMISGLRVGLAPIEDFAYPLAAVILLPALWLLLEPLTSRRRPHDR